MSECVYGVLLTDEGWHALGESLERFTNKGTIGNYIHASSINPEGQYFELHAISIETDTVALEADILIPHQMIKCVIRLEENLSTDE